MSPRKLFYPLDRTVNPSSITDEGFSGVLQFPDETTRIPLILYISEQEYVKLSSAIDVGSDIAYPEESTLIQWLLLGNIVSDICPQVADCIENSESVRNALNTFLADYGNGSEDKERAIRENAQQKSDDLLSFSSGGVCDLDALFACVSQMITLLHNNNLDALEIIEVETNANVELAQVVSSITFLDETSVDTVFNYVALIQNSISENYAASYTDELYDQIRCDIFCLAQEQCGLSIDILFGYFEEKMSLNSIDVNDITNLISFFFNLLDGSYIGNNVVYFMFYSQLALVRLADSLLTLLLQGNQTLNQANRLNLQIRAFSNDGDPDWEIICDPCGTETPYWAVSNPGINTVSSTATEFVFDVVGAPKGITRRYTPSDTLAPITLNSVSASGTLGVDVYIDGALFYAGPVTGLNAMLPATGTFSMDMYNDVRVTVGFVDV
jgi:hypothetical protein